MNDDATTSTEIVRTEITPPESEPVAQRPREAKIVEGGVYRADPHGEARRVQELVSVTTTLVRYVDPTQPNGMVMTAPLSAFESWARIEEA